MIQNLVEMYENGSITGYQLMMDALMRLDPEHPDLILAELPEEVLDEMLAYLSRYHPERSRSAAFQPPSEDRVRASERWINAHRALSSRPVNRS